MAAQADRIKCVNCRQDPRVLLELRCREAEARAMNGCVSIKVFYKDGYRMKVVGDVEEHYK